MRNDLIAIDKKTQTLRSAIANTPTKNPAFIHAHATGTASHDTKTIAPDVVAT